MTKEIIETITDLKNKLDNRMRVESRLVVDTYNKVFEGKRKHQAYTQCGSCLKRCITDMYNELKAFQTAQESLVEALEEVMDEVEDETPSEKPIKRKKK